MSWPILFPSRQRVRRGTAQGSGTGANRARDAGAHHARAGDPGRSRKHPARRWPALLLAPLLSCTLHHSKQALSAEAPSREPPPPEARFVTEEDSGLSIFGVFVLAEPDHYAVLLERLRRDYRCERLLYPQLDFYTDHWLLIAFPIARITSLCEPERAGGASPGAPIPPLAPATAPSPAPLPSAAPSPYAP